MSRDDPFNDFPVQDTFIDEESGARVQIRAHRGARILGSGGRPRHILIEVGGKFRTLDEFIHECPCCGSETEVGE